MKLSNQAMGAIMFALQKSLLEQTDIVPIIQNFNFKVEEDELVVSNPPNFKIDHDLVEEIKATTGSD